MSDNRAILLTPPGTAAIAVVRIAGPDACGFVARHFSKATVPGRCVYGNFTDGSRVIDDVLLVAVNHSTFDINLHGGNWVIRTALDLADREGFEVIESLTAPLPNEALDDGGAMEKEVLAYLPLARTEAGVRTLAEQPAAWKRWIESLLPLQVLRGRAGVGVCRTGDPAINEADPHAALQRNTGRGTDLSTQIQRIVADLTLHHLLFPPTVAIVGPANVGKSTLANSLFGSERSITHDMPGTTRDWVGEFTEVNGLPIRLLDTPGVRATHDAIESAAIDRSREEIDRSELIILVLDASQPLDEQAIKLLQTWPASIKVANKCDRPSTWDTKSHADLAMVATQTVGLSELRRKIVRHFCGTDQINEDRAYLWTPRHRQLCERALTDPSAWNELL